MFSAGVYDATTHELLNPELLDWCRRQCSDPELRASLFVYRAHRFGTFVIGRWLGKPKGLFVDLLNLGGSLANFTREAAQEFLHRTLRPVTAAQAGEVFRTSESRARVASEALNEEIVENRTRKVRDFT